MGDNENINVNQDESPSEGTEINTRVGAEVTGEVSSGGNSGDSTEIKAEADGDSKAHVEATDAPGTLEDSEAEGDTGAITDDDSDDKPECKDKANVVGIRFPNSGKTYCFCAGDLELSRYDRVVVESDLGINIGQVAKISCELNVPEKGLRPVLRKVTEVDIRQEEENDKVKREARDYAVERIKTRELPMKLLYTDVTLDRKRFIFYFVAETRIDFRELVKDLASKFRTRIELRQIGVRDAAKMIGGFGVCGQELCCKTWLKGFAPISIKMAKQQDLVLNTCKLSGLCGRLMCCLNYEYDPDGPKRRKPEPRSREIPSGEAMDKAIEAAVGSNGGESVDRTDAESKAGASSWQTPEQSAAHPGAEKPETAEHDGARRKKRRRRGGRKRNKTAQPQGIASGSPEPGDTGNVTEGQQAQGTGDGSGGQGKGSDQPRKDKPKRPRRRRRKPKSKKEE